MKTLCGDTKIDCVFPTPYNVNILRQREKDIQHHPNDNMERGKFREFLTAVFKNYVAYAKARMRLLCMSFQPQARETSRDCMENAGLKVKNQLIWKKNVASNGMGRLQMDA
jgi:hypothetical protein